MMNDITRYGIELKRDGQENFEMPYLSYSEIRALFRISSDMQTVLRALQVSESIAFKLDTGMQLWIKRLA
jgi:hypothetical protein